MKTTEIFYPSLRNYHITFVNASGEEFPIEPPNYLLLDFSGFELPNTDIQMTKAPYQDGKTFIDDLFEERYPVLEFAIFGTQEEILSRRLTINRIFNPHSGPGILRFQNVSTYEIEVITKSINFIDSTRTSHGVAVVQLVAPNPFWYDPTQVQKIMVGFSGGWSYPWSYPVSYGQIGTQLTVNNIGSETPVEIYLYGKLVNPTIKNLTTDQEISVIKTIEDGEILIINTAFGEKSAMILSGGEYINAFEYVHSDSEFWSLIPGENELTYTVSSEGENAECRVLYYHRFVGV